MLDLRCDAHGGYFVELGTGSKARHAETAWRKRTLTRRRRFLGRGTRNRSATERALICIDRLLMFFLHRSGCPVRFL